MSGPWKHQIRIDLTDDLADVARRDPDDPALGRLTAVLRKHHATLKCQFDAFADYVAEAERRGPADYPLYDWTKATIEDPAKKKKYLKSFSIYVDGQEVYPAEKAKELEADLRPLLDEHLIEQIFNFNSNPKNNPQPPARYRR